MKEEVSKNNGRGGRREGAGRPKGDRRLFSFRIEGRLADFIDSHKNRTAFIHNCIEEAFNRKEEGRPTLCSTDMGRYLSGHERAINDAPEV